MTSASSSSSSSSGSTPPWLTELWNAAGGNFYFMPHHWSVLRKIVGIVTGLDVHSNPKHESAPPSLVSDDRESVGLILGSARLFTTPGQLMRATVECAEAVLQRLNKADVANLPECLFQYTLFAVMSTYQPQDPDALRFITVRMEAKCKRLHSSNDDGFIFIDLPPPHSTGSPNQSGFNAQRAGRADLICSITDSKGSVVANYVLELKSVRRQSLGCTWAQLTAMSTDELMQLPGPDELPSALHQSRSYHSFDEINGQEWPLAGSPPVRHLAVVAVGHRVLVSDAQCAGAAPYVVSEVKESIETLGTASVFVKEASILGVAPWNMLLSVPPVASVYNVIAASLLRTSAARIARLPTESEKLKAAMPSQKQQVAAERINPSHAPVMAGKNVANYSRKRIGRILMIRLIRLARRIR